MNDEEARRSIEASLERMGQAGRPVPEEMMDRMVEIRKAAHHIHQMDDNDLAKGSDLKAIGKTLAMLSVAGHQQDERFDMMLTALELMSTVVDGLEIRVAKLESNSGT